MIRGVVLAPLPGGLQSSIPLGENFFFPPFELVFRRDVSDGAVKAHVVVMGYVGGDLGKFRDRGAVEKALRKVKANGFQLKTCWVDAFWSALTYKIDY